jgi:hypothetical protein
MGRRKKKQLTERELEEKEQQDWFHSLDNRTYIFSQLSKAKGKEVCRDEHFTYYSLMVDGRSLMYRKRSDRPDGRKLYKLTDQLAMLIGFWSMDSMKYLCRGLQVWRGYLSPERLNVAVCKYIRELKPYYS